MSQVLKDIADIQDWVLVDDFGRWALEAMEEAGSWD